MGIPLVVAAVFAAGCGLYKKYSNEKALDDANRTPGDSYRLPACCVEALNTASNRGVLSASIGAFVSTSALVAAAQPQRPSVSSVATTAKSGFDAGSLVMMSWEQEAALHASFAEGVSSLSALAMFNVIHEHYLKHAREHSDANKFWTKLYELKKKRLPNQYWALEEAYDSIDQ